MSTSEPLHVALVWHMHQPYYRSALTGAFEMPWARMHALKDYVDMVDMLSAFPDLHCTFNLVPSLVEQLEDYAAGSFVDVYWEHTRKPAVDLTPAERAFVVERMCERLDHPRTQAHPRYAELAAKREAHASLGWEACAAAFTSAELRDLQIWFELAWFDPPALETGPLDELVSRGRDFNEDDKRVIADVQTGILSRTLPAYREAARRGQIELSTSPYFHAILPLLANSDSARVGAPDTLLPPRRFAHPEDAAEQIRSAISKHEAVFGERPRGMWCSEQAVGEDVARLLIDAGLSWTISDETVLARSLAGAAGPHPRTLTPPLLYGAYRLEREDNHIAMVFRDHTLSDLIGFAYSKWDSREAAADLVARLRHIAADLRSTSTAHTAADASKQSAPLVTIALDGENAWEYYPRDGRDFLQHLYEDLSSEPSLRCVTISEHLREHPPLRSLGWLHTGSWIGGDLRTWSGDRAHNVAWDLLHDARDMAARHRGPATVSEKSRTATEAVLEPMPATDADTHVEEAWRHIMIAEGSDWFWWFGDHHHTELDYVWDVNFRLHLQQAYRLLDERVPAELFHPVLEPAPSAGATLPAETLAPTIDGVLTHHEEWTSAGTLIPDLPSTMQRAETVSIDAVRYGWQTESLCLAVTPAGTADLQGLELEIRVDGAGANDHLAVHLTLGQAGRMEVSCVESPVLAGTVDAAWGDIIEIRLPLDSFPGLTEHATALTVRVGRAGITDHVFHSTGLDSLGWGRT